MEIWHGLTQTFNSQADKYDPELVNPSEKFMHFKLAPGGDARQEAYKKLIDASEKLAEKLNDALGRGGLFVPEIILKDGQLETRVKYAEGDGGIFHVKTKQQDIGIGIVMTMPRQDVIRDAFKSLVTTPKFPIGDEIPEPDRVIPDAPRDPNAEAPQAEPQGQKPTLSDLGGVNIVGDAPLDQSPRREGVEQVDERIKAADGFGVDAKNRRGNYYVVFGDRFQGRFDTGFDSTSSDGVKWRHTGKVDNQSDAELPGKPFATAKEAYAARERLIQQLLIDHGLIEPNQTGWKRYINGLFNKPLSRETAKMQAFRNLHVKRWDGQGWQSTKFSLNKLLPDIEGLDLQDPAAPQEEAPLDNEYDDYSDDTLDGESTLDRDWETTYLS